MFNVQCSTLNYRGVKLNNKREAYLVKREAKKKIYTPLTTLKALRKRKTRDEGGKDE